MNDMIARPIYRRKLEKELGSSDVKVLTGIRRCGKSTLLKMIVEQMLQEGFPPSNVYFKRFDEFGTPIDLDASWLQSQLAEAMEQSDPAFPFRVFLDEVQEVPGWEKILRQLHTKESADVFITGSNAYVLSSDLSTFLAGRYSEIEVYPLSFSEYVLFAQEHSGYPNDTRKLFERYMTYGGMPGLFERNLEDDEGRAASLASMFDAVLLNDVAKRAKIRDIDLLEKIVRYLFSTSGSLFSTKRVANALTSSGRNVKPETIDNYIHALEMAFAIYECEQEGITGKRVLRPLRKFYAPDAGLRNMATGFTGTDIGYQLEGIVFMELKRRGYVVKVGALSDCEVDFVATRRAEKIYVQVSASVLDEGVFQREISPLEKIRDSFPKLILTLDGWRQGTTESGIAIKSLIDWLLTSD